MPSLSLPAFALAVLAFLCYYTLLRKPARNKLPPGPAPWPIIGNLLDLPPQGLPEYQHWLKHKDKYGPLSSVNIFGQTMLLVHDQEAASELLEKRSKVTSSRPVMEFANNLCGYGKFVSTQKYGDSFRLQRRFIHQQLGTRKAAEQYSDVHREEVARLLIRVLYEPQNLIEHFKIEAGAIILKIGYGYSVEKTTPDPLIRLVERLMANFSLALMPLAWSVDAIPQLNYLPTWLPGMSFKETAKTWNTITQMSADMPYSFTKQQMALNSHIPSVVSRLIDSCCHSGQKLSLEDEEAIKWSTGALYGGGADTSVSVLSSFILAMLKFPEVQKKAQEEIDQVLGPSCLPRSEDRDSLPYVEGVFKEALRWFPVAPLGLPHTTDDAIDYKGYLIPKGAYIIPAIWWFLHDPGVYKDPDLFDPTRHLSPRNEPDPSTYAFGFGRRTCPGKYVADSSLFLTIAQLLASFNIRKALDKEGNLVEPQIREVAGIINRPQEFPYRISPRSAAHRSIIQDLERTYDSQQGDSSKLGDALSVERTLAQA